MPADLDMRLLARRTLAHAARLLGLDEGQLRVVFDCDGSAPGHALCFGHVDVGVDPRTIHLNPAAAGADVEDTVSHELYHCWRALLGLPRLTDADEELSAETFVDYVRNRRSHHEH